MYRSDSAQLLATHHPARITEVLVDAAHGHGPASAVELALRGRSGTVSVRRCSGVTELYLRAAAARPGTVVVVDATPDPHSPRRPAERIIKRLARSSQLRVLAWAPGATPDAREGLMRAGATSLIDAVDLVGAAGAALSAALLGIDPVPAGPAPIDRYAVLEWKHWLEDRYGLGWSASLEPALSLLAETGEQAALADELVALEAVPSRSSGAILLRTLAKALAGEEYRNPGLVAEEAQLVLARLGAVRPLAYRPREAVSFADAAAALRDTPELAVAAWLTDDEVADLLAIDHLIRDKRARQKRSVGAPGAGLVWEERRWAAGQRAVQRGTSGAGVDALAIEVLTRATEAALAVKDARRDVTATRLADLISAVGSTPVMRLIGGPRRDWRPSVREHNVCRVAASA